ncbi:MAG: hypothetical protein ACYC96_09270 [Fimbriimonadaceae bacterium]
MQTPPTFTTMAAPVPPPLRVRFDAIGDAWRLYMLDMGQWIGGVLLAIIVTAAPIFVLELIVFGLIVPGGLFGAGVTPFGAPGRIESFRTAGLAISLASLPIAACTQLLSIGLQRRALLQARGLPSPISDMFNLDGMGMHVLLFNLLYVLIGLPVQLYSASTNTQSNPFAFFEPTHFMVLGGFWLAMAAIHLLLAFTPLIIVDQRLAVGPAIAKSVSTFGPHFWPLAGVLTCAYLLGFSGALACGIGFLFTAPVLSTVYGVVYNDFFRPAQAVATEQPSSWYPRQM